MGGEGAQRPCPLRFNFFLFQKYFFFVKICPLRKKIESNPVSVSVLDGCHFENLDRLRSDFRFLKILFGLGKWAL